MFNSLILFHKNNNLEAFLDNFFDESFFPRSLADINNMKVDIKDTKNAYLVEAEIPGVNKEQIKVDYQNNYLTINVLKQNEVNEEKENYIKKERSSRKVARTFYIENINKEDIKASYENGILKISLPKSQQASDQKTIKIE